MSESNPYENMNRDVDPIVCNREQWEKNIKAKYPNCVLDNTGTFIYAEIAKEDVGVYSIIGNWGKIFELDEPVIDRTVEHHIVALAAQLVDGLVSVTAFCDHCRTYRWIVHNVNVVTSIITLCHVTGKLDKDSKPIIIWKDVDASVIAR